MCVLSPKQDQQLRPFVCSIVHLSIAVLPHSMQWNWFVEEMGGELWFDCFICKNNEFDFVTKGANSPKVPARYGLVPRDLNERTLIF